MTEKTSLDIFKERAIGVIAPRQEFNQSEIYVMAIAILIGRKLREATMGYGNVYVHPDRDSSGELYYQIIITVAGSPDDEPMPEGSRSILVIANEARQGTISLVGAVVEKGALKREHQIHTEINQMRFEQVDLIFNYLLIGDELQKSTPVYH